MNGSGIFASDGRPGSVRAERGEYEPILSFLFDIYEIRLTLLQFATHMESSVATMESKAAGCDSRMTYVSIPNIPTTKRWRGPSFTPAALQHAWPFQNQPTRPVSSPQEKA
jgi:hypothetical protein